MASNIKVDIVRPTATNGSLSLKGDSGGAETTNGITVDSSGNTSITGTTTISSLVATTADINGGTIDNAEIGGSTPAAGSFTQVNAGDGAEATPSITNTGDTNTGIYFPAADTVGVSTGGSERMRIDSSGNVGINTTSPTHKLEVKDDDISVVKITSAADGNAVNGIRFRIINSTNTAQEATLGMVDAEAKNAWGGDLVFKTKQANSNPDESVTERMRIDASGNVQLTGSLTAGTLGSGVVFPAGMIRNSVFNSYSTSVGVVTTAYTATGLQITITPTSTDSDIFLIFSQQYLGVDSSGGDWSFQYKITRTVSGTETDIFEQNNQALYHSADRNDDVLTFTYKDSPSTTSAITYKIYGRDSVYGGDLYFQNGSSTSTAMAFEVL